MGIKLDMGNGTVLDSTDWLWCHRCERFFQARELRKDVVGYKQGCPFCEGCGLHVDIHEWDWVRDEKGDLPDHWARNTEDLSSGMDQFLYPKKSTHEEKVRTVDFGFEDRWLSSLEMLIMLDDNFFEGMCADDGEGSLNPVDCEVLRRIRMAQDPFFGEKDPDFYGNKHKDLLVRLHDDIEEAHHLQEICNKDD